MEFLLSELAMKDTIIEITIIIDQKDSMGILKTLKDSKLSFELITERQFAPTSPEVAIQIITNLPGLLAVAVELFKKIHSKNGYVDFQTRHKLAREMLAELEPLLEIKSEDKKEYSYYLFRTTKGKHYWEYDRGEIEHGPLQGSKSE